MFILIKEFLSWTPAERKHVIKTAMAPYESRGENINLWFKIVWLTIFIGLPSIEIFKLIYVTHQEIAFDRIMLLIFFGTMAVVNVVYWGIFTSLMNAMQERIVEERAKMKIEFDKILMNQKQKMLDHIREAAGRDTLPMDPISIVAATIDATEVKTSVIDPSINPLQAALDGTLLPEHLLPPEDETPDYN